MDRPGYFFEPTILAGLSDGTRIVDEEQFGPALPVVSYRDLGDAIDRANATHFGLSGSVWSADPDRAAAVAAQLECGTAWVNTHLALAPQQPFGGFKWSGIGVENGPWGLAEFSEFQVVHRSKAANGLNANTAPCCLREHVPASAGRHRPPAMQCRRRGRSALDAAERSIARGAVSSSAAGPGRCPDTSRAALLIAVSDVWSTALGRGQDVVVGVPLGRREGEHGRRQAVVGVGRGADLAVQVVDQRLQHARLRGSRAPAPSCAPPSGSGRRVRGRNESPAMRRPEAPARRPGSC